MGNLCSKLFSKNDDYVHEQHQALPDPVDSIIESNVETHGHSNTGILCDVFQNQEFCQSNGPSLKERLQPDKTSNKFGKIHKNLYALLGNGKNSELTILEIVAKLFP